MAKTVWCPNCGAVLVDNHCLDCGAQIIDLTEITKERPTYVKLQFDRKIMIFRALLTNVGIRFEDTGTCYCDNTPFIKPNMSGSVTLELDMLTDKDDVLFRFQKD